MGFTRGMLALLLAGLAGCASAPPPKELVSARESYERARSSAAAELAPMGLRDARAALDEAERAFASDRESREARDLAYIAERKAQLAESLGSTAAAERHRGAALQVYGEIQIALRKRAEKAASAAKRAEAQGADGAGTTAEAGKRVETKGRSERGERAEAGKRAEATKRTEAGPARRSPSGRPPVPPVNSARGDGM